MATAGDALLAEWQLTNTHKPVQFLGPLAQSSAFHSFSMAAILVLFSAQFQIGTC